MGQKLGNNTEDQEASERDNLLEVRIELENQI